MKIFCKKLKAFTLAEVTITFTIIAIVVIAGLNINKAKKNYETKFMTYAAFTNLQQLVGELMAEGCTTTDTTGDFVLGYCDGAKYLPKIAYTTSSTRNLCARLTDKINTIGTVNCGATNVTNTTTSFDSTHYTTFLNFQTTNGLRFFNFNTTAPYTIYVDVNGSKGSGVLGTDVVSFTVNTDGSAYPTVNTAAATSTNYLSTSVRYGGSSWLERGVTYKQAACNVGTLSGAYCAASGSIPAYSQDTTNCPSANNTCEVVLDKPSFSP